MRSAFLLCNLLAACATANSGPTVVIVPYESDGRVEPWTRDDVGDIISGAEAWDDLGFLYLERDVNDVPYEAEMERCPRDWDAQHLTECAIPIGVTHEFGMIEKLGVVGLANRTDRIIIIDSRFHGNGLSAIAAHEFGHILLNTSRHLSTGQRGIMMPYMGPYLRPTTADLTLACEETGICVND